MTPFRFGPAGSQLFGILHAPSKSVERTPPAVLLCPPFGQEAIRVHRLSVLLMERLAALGSPSMRFDYYGSGDSDGDGEEASLDRWVSDVAAANQELVQRSGASRCLWIGFRLGATLAALASSRARLAPSGLLLWDPVVDGTAYLAELAVQHGDALKRGYGRKAIRWATTAGSLGPGQATEVMGFELPGALRDQIAAIGPDLFETCRTNQVEAILGSNAPDPSPLRAAFERSGHAFRANSTREDFDWTSDNAINGALVPNGILECLVRSIAALA